MSIRYDRLAWFGVGWAGLASICSAIGLYSHEFIGFLVPLDVCVTPWNVSVAAFLLGAPCLTAAIVAYFARHFSWLKRAAAASFAFLVVVMIYPGQFSVGSCWPVDSGVGRTANVDAIYFLPFNMPQYDQLRKSDSRFDPRASDVDDSPNFDSESAGMAPGPTDSVASGFYGTRSGYAVVERTLPGTSTTRQCVRVRMQYVGPFLRAEYHALETPVIGVSPKRCVPKRGPSP